MKRKVLIIFGAILLVVLIAVVSCVLIKGKAIPVIMYHGVAENPPKWASNGEDLFIDPKNFEEQMKYIKEHNYETIFVEDIENNHSGGVTLILTFDDGYEDFYTNVLPILKKYNLKANLYVITNSINKKDYLSEEQLKEIADSKLVSIGSHTHNHNVLKDLSEEQIEYELKTSKEILEKIINKKVRTISYPTGAYDDRVLKLAEKYYDYGINTNPDIQFMKDFNKYTISRRGMGRSSSMFDFKKILFRASLFRFGK